MLAKRRFCLLSLILAGALGLFSHILSAQSQTLSEGPPKLKDFGSSIKRLKWDAKKGVAVESKSNRKANRAAVDDDVVRVDTVLAVCDLLVIDRQSDHVINGLTRKDFLITEDDAPQQIASFSLGNDLTRPRSIVLVIDYSASQLPYLDTSIEAAKTLADQLGPSDKMAIVTDDVSLLLNFTRDKARLRERLDSLKRKAHSGTFGQSFQFSALFATLRELVSMKNAPSLSFRPTAMS